MGNLHSTAREWSPLTTTWESPHATTKTHTAINQLHANKNLKKKKKKTGPLESLSVLLFLSLLRKSPRKRLGYIEKICRYGFCLTVQLNKVHGKSTLFKRITLRNIIRLAWEGQKQYNMKSRLWTTKFHWKEAGWENRSVANTHYLL